MKRPVIAAIVAVSVVAVLMVAIPLLANVNEFRPRLETTLSTALGRPVTLGELSLSIFSGSLQAQDLTIAEDARFGTAPFVRAKSLSLGVDLWPLLVSRQLNINDLTITEPEFNLTQGADGVWNFSTIGPKTSAKDSSGGAPMNLSVKLIALSNGRITLTQAGAKPAVLGDVTMEVKDFAAGAKFPFSFTGKLGKGDVKLDGTAGPINPSDASQTPVQMTLKMSGVDLNGVAMAAGSGVSGVVAIDGSGSVQGTTLAWKGKVHMDQAKFVPQGNAAKQAVEFNFTVEHNLKDHSGVLSRGDILLGSATASLTGTYAENAGKPMLNLHLKGAAMPVSALEGMLPALNIEMPAGSRLQGGTAAVDATVTGPAASPVVDGTVGLSNTKLAGFDLGMKVGAIERIAGIQPSNDTTIQALNASLRSDAAGITLRSLALQAPALGEVDGVGTISAKHELDLKMRVTLRSGMMTAALGGKTAIPFFVQGTVSNPDFKPDVSGIAAAEINRLGGVGKTGGIDAGKLLNGIFGHKK